MTTSIVVVVVAAVDVVAAAVVSVAVAAAVVVAVAVVEPEFAEYVLVVSLPLAERQSAFVSARVLAE